MTYIFENELRWSFGLPMGIEKIPCITISFLFFNSLRSCQSLTMYQMMKGFVQNCLFVQSSFLEDSSILKMPSITSVTDFSTVKDYSNPSYLIVFGKEVHRFLASVQFIDC